MKLEDQCVSLELAKRMKELKFEQESLFYWVQLKDSSKFDIWFTDTENLGRKFYSAYTVAELADLLPKRCRSGKCTDPKSKGRWVCGYKKKELAIRADTLPDAMAKMLIYLHENNPL